MRSSAPFPGPGMPPAADHLIRLLRQRTGSDRDNTEDNVEDNAEDSADDKLRITRGITRRGSRG